MGRLALALELEFVEATVEFASGWHDSSHSKKGIACVACATSICNSITSATCAKIDARTGGDTSRP